MKTWIAAIVGLVAVGGGQEKPTVKDLAWLAGRWEGPSAGGTFEEHWMTPAGGLMIGMGRLVKGDKTVFTEFLKIVETKESVEYRALVGDQPETAFKLKSKTADEVIFENPDHDFPQRVGYRKEKDGLFAWIEGTKGGKSSKMEFNLKAKPIANR